MTAPLNKGTIGAGKTGSATTAGPTAADDTRLLNWIRQNSMQMLGYFSTAAAEAAAQRNFAELERCNEFIADFRQRIGRGARTEPLTHAAGATGY